MSSNSVKNDSARKWHKLLGHLNKKDVERNAPETVGELDDVCNVCAFAKITKSPVPTLTETRAEEKLERVFTDVMVPSRGKWCKLKLVRKTQYRSSLYAHC